MQEEEDQPLSSRVSLRSGEQQAGRVYHLHHLQPLSGCPGEGNVPRWRPEPRAALAEANGMRWGPRHLGAGWGVQGGRRPAWPRRGLTRVAVCEEGADGEENFRNG